ncbi:MAG: hypothetical protein CMJ64_21440 [Planctomycetaceae bacterium]|nr:hypothetical protein [Planctomycetaceae bacterium]
MAPTAHILYLQVVDLLPVATQHAFGDRSRRTDNGLAIGSNRLHRVAITLRMMNAPHGGA